MDFMAKTETREVLSLAYAVFNRLPEEKARVYRPAMAQAKLPELRLLAED